MDTRVLKSLTKRQVLVTIGGLATSWLPIPHGHADSYPTRPIRLIIPYAPGGGTDTVGRAIAEEMSRSLGQPIIVENRGGANASIGSTVAAKANPDGYTILYGTDANLVLNPLLYKNLTYDPQIDFVSIGLLAEVPQLIAISPKINLQRIEEFIQYLRLHPGKLNYASAGRGGNGDLAAEMFMQEFSLNMQPIAFNGSVPALSAVLSGTVEVYFGTMAAVLPHIKANKLIPLAVLTPNRQVALPEVPTVAESGAPGFDATLRVGLVAHSKTPLSVVARLNEALNAALDSPKLRHRLENAGFNVAQSGSPERFTEINARSREIWAKVIQSRKISLD
ncbi:MAG: tripartite tricarboxylate transporter substrate binding protein [Alcaligenaceae bacterium]